MWWTRQYHGHRMRDPETEIHRIVDRILETKTEQVRGRSTVMGNRMQDLDFKQAAAFESVQDFEFTRKAAQRFREVVSLDSFEEEDAEVIFHYLYKEMELVSFGDYLKRYVYERAGLEEAFHEVPKEIYRDIIIDSFKETFTPKSMTPTSTKLPALVNNWLTQASVKRDTVFLLGFGLRMSAEDVSGFLTRVLREQDFDFQNPEEVIYWYCYNNHYGYYKTEELRQKYNELAPSEKKEGEVVYGAGLCLDSEEKLLNYLAYQKSGWEDPKSEKSQAFSCFMELYEQGKELVAEFYRKDEEEERGGKVWTTDRISPADMEKVICSGIPINEMGNLKKMSASILAKHFSQKRFSRQRITSILNHKFPVERFDLITLEFFIISQKMAEEDPYNRYQIFLQEIQEILKKCGMGEIYIVNPYESFILMCLLTDCPLAVFSEIWEMSYEPESC